MTKDAEQLMDYDLTHEFGGNGLVIVEDCGDEMVRVAAYNAHHNEVGSRAFLVWIKLLRISQRDIFEEAGNYFSKVIGTEPIWHHCPAVELLRKEISAGRIRIVETRIENVK